MASTKEKKLTKYEQNTARRNARSIGDSGTSQTAQSSVHKSDKQRQLEQFAQNFEQKYGKPIQTANQANTANQTGTASKSAVQNQITDRQRMSLYQNTSATLPNLNRLEVDRDLALHPEENPATAFYTNAAVDQLKQQAKAVSSVPIEDAGTEKMDQPAVEGTNSVLDYAGYTAQKLGAGTVGTVGSLEGGLRQTAQDLISGGKVSSDFQKIEQFLQANPAERSMIDRQGRILNEGMVQSIADRIGVLPDSLQTYLIATEPERIDRSIEQSYPGLNETYKSVAGQGAYMLGQQLPGLLLGAIAPAGQAGGIVKSAVGAARTGGARAALSAAAKSAVRGNLTTQLIGASSYSQSLQQNARQYGMRPETYADAIADGMVDAMTEGLFDNASVDAMKNMLGTATGSASKTLMKQLLRYALTGAEEGLEEVVAGPLQGLSEKIFLDRDKKWFGDGGVFDVNQMMKDGVAGAAMGLLLGGIGSVVSAYDAIQTSKDIASNVEQINASAQKIDPEFRPETRNPASQTVESATEYAAEVLSGFADQAQKVQQEARRAADTSQSAIADSSPQGEPSMRQVDKMAATFGKSGEAAFREAAKNTPVEALPDLYDSFVASYNSASRKITPEQADRINHMPADLRTAAYQAGIADYSASAKQAAKPGLVKDQTYRKARYTAKTERTLDTIAKAAGVQVKIVDKIPAYDANGNLLGMANARYHNGAIEIARNAKDPAGVAFTHEIVHRVRQADPEAYRAMARLVIDSLSDERYSSALASRSKEYRDLDESNMQEELVADAFGRVLGDSEYLDRIVRQNRTVWQRILDTIRDFISRIRYASSIVLNESERQEFSELAGRAEQMASLLENALDRAQTAQRIQTENAAQEGGTARYSIRRVDGKNVVWIENSSLTNKELNNHKAVADFIAQHIGEVYTIIESGQKVYIGPDLPGEYTQSKYTTYLRNTDRASARAKNKAVGGLGELIETATNRQWERTRHMQSKDAEYGMYRYDGTFAFPVKGSGGTVQRVRAYDAELLIRNASDGKKYLYDIVNVKENTAAQIDLTKKEARSAAHKAATGRGVSDTSISETGRNVNGRDSTKTGDWEDGIVKYSINPSFRTEIHQWYEDGQPEGERFVLGSTGPVLQGLGAIESDIYINGDKVSTILQQHPEMTIREIQRIPEVLEDPVMVLKSKGAGKRSSNSRLVLFGSLKAQNGEPVMSVLDLRPTENGFLLDDMQKVNSAYTKKNPDRFISDSEVLYADEKRTVPLLRRFGLTIASRGLLRNGSMGSISYGGKNVNISGVPLSSVVEIDRDNPNQAASPDTRYSLMSSEISDMSNRLTEQLQAVNARVDAGEITQEEATAQKMAILQAPIRDLIAQYGQMEPGERPFRDITIPRKTGENMRVSRTARTALEAEATPDELVPDIEQLVAEGAFSYEAYGDEQAIQDAENKILEAGYETALTDWTSDVRSGNVSKLNTALGWRLYDEAANRQDMKTAMTVLTNLIEHQRNAAQAVQATRILKQMPPSAQLYGVQRSIQNLQEEINRRYGAKKGPELKIDEDLAQQFMEAQSQQERDVVLKEIYRDIGRQMPSTFLDKWNAWRYFAMLGNPRTHIRNIVGNLGFAPVVAAKNLTATAIESAVYRVTGGRTQRTKGAIGTGKADRALLKACWGDYSNVQDVAMGSAKYNDSVNANQYIQEGRRIFKSENRTLNKLFSPIEKASRGNSRLLEAEDLVFFKPHYAYALAQYCKANHISAEAVQSGKIPDAARAYAIREAQKATYRDTNQFSQIISNLGRTDRETALGKGLGMVAEGILPFRKTPANILVRGLEYSPLGLLNALKIGVKDVKAGKATAADVIDALSSGLTGTGLLALGFFLAAEGMILGGGEDEDESKFLELQGHQQYSLEAGGQSFTLDWLAPEALPFFVGVNLYEQSGKEGGATAADWLTAIQNISEPLLEMSCLQSLNDLFDNIGYARSEGITGISGAIVGAATSYLTQALPTVFGQLERTGQPDRMSTFTNQDSVLTSEMQYTLGRASARIPGWDYQQIPYIDAWGRTESEDSTTARAVDNFLNPAYRSEITESEMESELLRLYDQTGSAAVFPSRVGKVITVDGEDKYLTGDEYVQYATEKGQMSYEIMTDLVKNSAYKNLSDEDKVEVISDVYSYANAVAKTSVSDYTPESWIQKASAAEAEGIPVELYIVAKHATGSVTEGIPSRSDPSKSIENSTSLLKMQQLYNVKGLTDEQRQTLYESFNISESVRNYNKAAVDEKIQRMRQRGR